MARLAYESELKGERGILDEEVTDHGVIRLFLISAFVHCGNIIGGCFPKDFRDSLPIPHMDALTTVEKGGDLIVDPLEQRMLVPG